MLDRRSTGPPGGLPRPGDEPERGRDEAMGAMPDEFGNIFEPAPREAPEEQVTVLVSRGGLTIERIVSTGQASPPGFWYNQAQDEWVLVLSGEAGLRLEGDAAARRLKAGDYALLPAHRRHRVEWTDPEQATIWLAVHFRPEPG
jgi:cupin 2 domain-containing protein